MTMAEGFRDAPIAFSGSGASKSFASDNSKRAATSPAQRASRSHRGGSPHAQPKAAGRADSEATDLFQDPTQSLDSRSSFAESEFYDAASDASSLASASSALAEQEDALGLRGSSRQAAQSASPSGPTTSSAQPDQHIWKAKLEEALQAKVAAEDALVEQQAQNDSLRKEVGVLQVPLFDPTPEHPPGQPHASFQYIHERKNQGEASPVLATSSVLHDVEPRQVAAARLAGHVVGRVIAAHEAEHSWSTKMATLQMRLERMGRMEASMAAARRSMDDSSSATRRRFTNAAIAVGATSCGALAAWFIVSRLQLQQLQAK